MGAILSAFMGGWLLTVMTARHVFLLAALIPLSLILVAVVVVEDRWEGEMQRDEVYIHTHVCVYIM